MCYPLTNTIINAHFNPQGYASQAKIHENPKNSRKSQKILKNPKKFQNILGNPKKSWEILENP